MSSLKSVSTVVGVLALLVGCSGSSDDGSAPGDELDVTSGAAALQACGAAKFNEALPHYQSAVKNSKLRNAGEGCAEDKNGMTSTQDAIANEAARAVFVCPAFKDVMKNSPFAAPIRKALAPMLTLKALTGELAVLRDSEFQNWSNVEALFPGTTLWATQDHGPLFFQDTFDFKAGGAGVRTHFNDAFKDETTPFTYRIEKTGAEKDPRKVIITIDGKTTTYELGVVKVPASNFETAPVFRLTTPGDANAWTTSFDECSV